jgi:hypothetical protein
MLKWGMKNKAVRDTSYATELCLPGTIRWPDGSEGRIERLFVKEPGHEEIRFSWWTKNGTMARRPLDLPEEDLIKLFQDALSKGVFTENFRSQLRALV